MAAAYAALVSLMHIIERIQLHPRPPISLEKTQVETLIENIAFLQEFLEGYSYGGNSKEADDLESRIADAAYAAEDIIESHIVDQILAGSTDRCEEISSSEEINTNSIDFYQILQKVIQDMDSIKKEVMEIKKEMGVEDQLQRSSTPVGSSRISSTGQNTTMVGFDDVLLEVMEKLIGGRLDRQIIPIVGMGGIGKTTLAKSIYQNEAVVQHFDILVWVTVSQEYRLKEILLELLEGDGGNLDERKLGEKLHKRLSGRRYLIIMDDIWDIEVWDQLKFFFPDNNNESRIVLTTRLSNLASQVVGSGGIEMGLLDEDNGWNLFSQIVFGKEGCPLELEEIGKEIVKNCRGLPLSITVIGGLLAKSKRTQEYWKHIAENLNSVVNSEDNERCLKVLQMSYNQLPVHLKPCFLYVGVFKEDSAIRVSTLVKLWVAEGFLKPVRGKVLEETAEEYLKELIDRNLIFVHGLGKTGNIKHCKIHDLLRDLCCRVAQKERFYNVMRGQSSKVPQDINAQRRIVLPDIKPEELPTDALRSMSLVRSLICNFGEVLPSRNFRLLRILTTYSAHLSHIYDFFLGKMFQLVNSRYLAFKAGSHSRFPSSVCLLYNLHTLIVESIYETTAPVEIWNMPQLRHVKFCGGLYLPYPPSRNIGGQDDIVLGNLQTLVSIINVKCDEEVVKRIPNIKKLSVEYNLRFESDSPDYSINNLERLHKLESFGCRIFLKTKPPATYFLENLTFPHSLKKVTIASNVHWEDTLKKVGSLPLLEKLKIFFGGFKAGVWETVEGQFRSLKYLELYVCPELKYWKTESSHHFPRLERLVLRDLYKLKEIPSVIGDVPTLQSIFLRECAHSVVMSAKEILEEQEESYGEQVALKVKVSFTYVNKELKSLESRNFVVEYCSDSDADSEEDL